MRSPTILAAAGGLLAIAAAATLRFAVVPAQAQLPADTDTTRTYTGTIGQMLDAEALASADLANVLVRDVPVTIVRQTAVTSVDGGRAVVAESSLVTAPDGSTVLASGTELSIDRRTMLDERGALAIGWPIGTEARDHVGHSTEIGQDVTLAHLGTEVFRGVEAYVFESRFSGQIVDPTLLARFPASLPKAMLPLVAGVLDVPAELAAALPTLSEALPDEVPLGYWLDSSTTYWVDPTTGMVLDLDRSEVRSVALDVPGVPATPLAEVFSLSYRGDDASVAATIDEARANAGRLTLFGTTLPLGLALVGLALLATAFLARRRPTATAAAPAPADERVPVGV